jgi:recombination protein RecT
MLCVFAIAKTKDGGVYIEVMSRSQIEQVRSISRSGNNGPWASWFGEMARKTVIRRLSKRLPMSTDLAAIIQRDDELYDLDRTTRTATSGRDATKAMLGLPVLPDADDAAAGGIDTDTGEIVITDPPTGDGE